MLQFEMKLSVASGGLKRDGVDGVDVMVKEMFEVVEDG